MTKNANEYPMYQLQRARAELLEAGLKVFDFGTGDPREPTAEFIRKEFINSVPEVSQYPSIKGSQEFRQACADWVKRRFKVNLNIEENILALTGAKEGIFHITPVLVKKIAKKDTIIIAAPGYQIPKLSAEIFGVNVYTVDLNQENNWKLDLDLVPKETLERAAAVWFNYPHNPTGQTVSLDFLKQQYNIAREYGIVFCSDETYVDLYLDDKSIPPSALELGTDDILVFHSCSKRSGMTGYRTGFVAGDPRLIADYTALRSVMGVATPITTQAAAIAAWSDDLHVRVRRECFNQKREIIQSALEEMNIEFLAVDATFYIWCETPEGQSSSEYTAKLLKKGIIVSPESHFMGTQDKYFRIALVPTVNDCSQAVKLWKEIA
ncbi:MAG: aminotransferase class I/II-fold pyridoxal phosphate-dependent enzyme [Bdellovibrionota bacterium]